jgi:transcriptional antiterminator RfaH
MTLKTDDFQQTDWYVVHTKPRQEVRAFDNLQNQHYECYLPMSRVQKVRAKGVEVVQEPLFSRYLFIRLDAKNQNWSPIRSTVGVASLVRFGAQPAKVPSALIDYLRQAPQPEVRQLYEAGDAIDIHSGPFAGLSGIYQTPNGQDRALILIDLLGKTHAINMALTDIRMVA